MFNSMEAQKKVSIKGEWAEKKVDYFDGDVLEIKDAGKMITGEYGDRQVHTFETKNGDKLISLNQTTINNLVDAYGSDTDNWVGKKVRAFIVKMNVAGKMVNVAFFADESWEMNDDNGEFAPAGVQVGKAPINPKKKIKSLNETEVDPASDDEVRIEDIPF
jgi:hypothetical protein